MCVCNTGNVRRVMQSVLVESLASVSVCVYVSFEDEHQRVVSGELKAGMHSMPVALQCKLNKRTNPKATVSQTHM